MSKSKNYCFTFNNYTDADYTDIKKYIQDDPKINYSIIGKEVGEKGTPHLQGFIQYKNQRTFKTIKKVFDKKVHIERCKGTAFDNYIYCSKDKNYEEFYTENRPKKKGTRTDLTDIKEYICENLDKMSLNEIKLEKGDNYQQIKFIENMYRTLKSVAAEEEFLEGLEGANLNEAQTSILEVLNSQNDRQILWVCDREGGKGKSFLAKYLIKEYNALVYTGATTKDMAYIYNYEKYVVFDFSRSKEGYEPYNFIEQLKNGVLISQKYESEIKKFKPPKIICFSNFYPDTDKLSEDRWVIQDISNDKFLL
jgi:hypothetical protein